MLADLDQSKQLMDRFCDSELLEGLDMVLAGSRLHAPQRVGGLPQLGICCGTVFAFHIKYFCPKWWP